MRQARRSAAHTRLTRTFALTEFAPCQLCRPRTLLTFAKRPRRFSAGAETLPQRYFVSPEIFAEGVAEDIRHQWVLVGSSEPARGTRRLFPCGGSRREFDRRRRINDRRSARFTTFAATAERDFAKSKTDTCAAIQCPYHAWTYALDGRLIGAPHMDETPGFNKAEYSLKPGTAWSVGRFIFVNLADASAVVWRNGLRRSAGKFSPWNLATLRSAKRIEYDVRAQLEVNVSKLFGVLSLPGRASGAVEDFTVRFRRE